MLEKVPQNLIFRSFPEISLKFPQNFGIHTNFFQDILITNFLEDFLVQFRYAKRTVPHTDPPVGVLQVQVYMSTFESNIELSNFRVFEKITKTDNRHAIG